MSRSSLQIPAFLRTGVSLTLSGLLIAGSGFAETPRTGATATTGGLSVTTDPENAAVYVDGHLAGQTPANLSSIAAGEHRVRIVKTGYLENARVVTVSAGPPTTLKVTLTRIASSAAASDVEQVTSTGGGGGSKKWIIIGAAAGGAAIAAVALSKKTSPPNPGTVSVSPNETGLAASTTFSFTASGASDPNGNSLTFAWDFGDGSSATGQTATHVYSAAGSFSPKVTVNNGKSSATATGSVSVKDLTGTWSGPLSVSTVTMNLVQNNTSVTGTYTGTFVCNSIAASGTVSATVSAAKTIRFTLTSNQGCNATVLQGTADATVSVASGSIVSGFNSSTLTFSITRR